ncbi:MAG: hypothetical protein H6955_18775 [Chromatiaceae bacterium]|nr:hypothetical protein [Chromatiaceae bacterium]
MDISESQIYEGPVTALGGEGPNARWIVVNPAGRLHAHSLDDPLDLHCMPIGLLQIAFDAGRVRLIDTQPDHPVIHLQREKERLGIRDTHLGLHGAQLDAMLQLLEKAVATGADYARYLAGEILAGVAASHSAADEMRAVRDRVMTMLGGY